MAEQLSGVNCKIIRWAREFYNMSPDEAAQAIGVDISRYLNWENWTEHPTYAKLKRLAMYLGSRTWFSFFLNLHNSQQ